MGTERYSARIKPVVTTLLERAACFAADGEADHAGAFYRAAVAADQTAVAAIAYGVFLADSEREVAARKQLEAAWESAKRCRDQKLCALACHNLAALHRRMGQPVIQAAFSSRLSVPGWSMIHWHRFRPT